MSGPLPRVDILIPTLNAAGVLASCLESLRAQDYPRQLVRVLVADGGSADETRDIAERYGATMLDNPRRTGEAGKAVALRAARAELVAFLDADNILPNADWLRRMVVPFEETTVLGAEPIRFTYRREDGFITRYCALLGMNDPLCLFLGNYDRACVLTGRWTDLPVPEEQRAGYWVVTLTQDALPTIGANGALFRRAALAPFEHESYLFDVDLLARLTADRPARFAKVDVGIVHLYAGSSVRSFLRKQRRRAHDYLTYRPARLYPWGRSARHGLMAFVGATLFVFPLLRQSWRGYRRKPDRAWWFHPFACWLTFWAYAVEALPAVPRLVRWRSPGGVQRPVGGALR